MNIDYEIFHFKTHLPKLDFTEKDGSDPLEINNFYYNHLEKYHSNKLSTVRIVKENGMTIGYFTVSMNAIELGSLDKHEKVPGTTPKKYPAMLLGRMGVDKKYRNKGIGKMICKFCQGLAVVVGEDVACRYIILHTTLDKVSFYEKLGFVKSANLSRKIVSMYMRIV